LDWDLSNLTFAAERVSTSLLSSERDSNFTKMLAAVDFRRIVRKFQIIIAANLSTTIYGITAGIMVEGAGG
jgi:hypothetical protein